MNDKSVTKGDINRLGDKIRREIPSLESETLKSLQVHRISHKESINIIFNSLCSLSKRVRKNAIVTYRLKRIESIIGKLDRLKDQQFSRMWDIAGCRCILNNDREVYRLKKLIEKKFNVKKVNDYIENPKPNGYRSLHLYINIPNDDKIIEVQLRNVIDHNWATLVEITDLIFDSQLKEYGKDKTLEEFLFLFSKRESLSYKERVFIAKTLKEYNYYDNLSNVFSRNYLEVRKRWLELETRINHKFFLIETRKDQIPKLDSFKTFNNAEEEYFQRYLNKKESNIVLTHLTNPSYKNISSAYSNYILTVHNVLDNINFVLETLIIESLKNNKIRSFFKHYNLYLNITAKHINNLNSEILLSSELSKNGKSSLKNLKIKKEHEWKVDIVQQKVKIERRINKLGRDLDKVRPKSKIITYILKKGTKYIQNKNSKLVIKHNL